MIYCGDMQQTTLLIRVSSILGIVLLVVGAVYVFTTTEPKVPHYNEIHIHADFAVYLDGERVDFSESIYHSDEQAVRHPFLHLHDGDGDVLHIHAKNQTLAAFFESIGIRLDENCLTRGTHSYCRGDNLRMFINGKEWTEPFTAYTPRDLDRIVLTNTDNPETLKIEKTR